MKEKLRNLLSKLTALFVRLGVRLGAWVDARADLYTERKSMGRLKKRYDEVFIVPAGGDEGAKPISKHGNPYFFELVGIEKVTGQRILCGRAYSAQVWIDAGAEIDTSRDSTNWRV